jgi:hypothetical protein
MGSLGHSFLAFPIDLSDFTTSCAECPSEHLPKVLQQGLRPIYSTHLTGFHAVMALMTSWCRYVLITSRSGHSLLKQSVLVASSHTLRQERDDGTRNTGDMFTHQKVKRTAFTNDKLTLTLKPARKGINVSHALYNMLALLH